MTEITEATAQLVDLVCAMRGDWADADAHAAILAAKTAGTPWPRIARSLVDLASRDENPPTSPRDLWNDIRGIKAAAGPGAPLDPKLKARVFADIQAVTDARNRATAPQPALRLTGELELLREGPDP